MDSEPVSVTSSGAHKVRQSLRDYQRELAERTTSAQAAPVSSSRQLGFLAAGCGWLIDLSDAAEIMPIPAVTTVPGTRPWFLGLINHRGKLTGVVDFERFVDHESPSRQTSGRLIVLSDRFSIACSLRVAAVSGLMDVPGSLPPEDLSLSAGASAAGSVEHPRWQGPDLRVKGKVWRRLDVAALISDNRFANAAL